MKILLRRFIFCTFLIAIGVIVSPILSGGGETPVISIQLEKKPIAEKIPTDVADKTQNTAAEVSTQAPVLAPAPTTAPAPITTTPAKLPQSTAAATSEKKDINSVIDMSGLEEKTTAKPQVITPNKISLDYKDADLASVLRALSYSYNLNLVALRDIKGKVTISLRDVSIDEALDAILVTNGYAYYRKGNIIYISPGPSSASQGIITKAVNIRFIPVDEAYKLFSKMLSDKGSMSVSDANNSLIISDYPSTFEKLDKILETVDMAPQQVIIEAKLVDMQANDYTNLGVTYTVDYNPLHGLWDRKTSTNERITTTQTFTGPSSDLTGGQIKLTTFTIKGLSVTATLDALIQDGKAHLLASPSIATLNGKEARIVIGKRVPYKEKTTTTTGTVENTKFIDVGTTLKVLPRISEDGFITMNIHPEVSSLVSNDALTGPTVDTREADVMVRIKDGDTFVIGGLIKSEDNKTINRLPILGYIPILEYLFSDRSSKKTQQELVVFITPHLIKTKEQRIAEAKLNKPEVIVDVIPTGERDLAMQFYERAENLHYNRGAESLWKDRSTRFMDAVDSYLLVSTQFPNNPKADDSLYKAGDISLSELKDYERASNIFKKLVADYPKSEFTGKANRALKKIERKLKAKK